MDKETILASGILKQYILGLTTPEETEQVEKMAAKYPEIDQKICELQDCMDQYIEMRPCPTHRSLKRKANSDATDVAFKTLSVWVAGGAALLLMGLIILVLALYQKQQMSRAEIAGLNFRMGQIQRDYLKLKEKSSRIMHQYAVLKDASTMHVPLNGTDQAPQALAMVFLNQKHEDCYMNIVNLPQAPDGHEYHMWANVNGKHISLGVLSLADTLSLLHHLPFIKGCSGFAITLEKNGETSRPSMDKMYVMGAMPSSGF